MSVCVMPHRHRHTELTGQHKVLATMKHDMVAGVIRAVVGDAHVKTNTISSNHCQKTKELTEYPKNMKTSTKEVCALDCLLDFTAFLVPRS